MPSSKSTATAETTADKEAAYDLLTPSEKKTLDILSRHRGRGNAIHMASLAREVGTTARRIRGIVQTLAVTYGYPIGKGVADGYFWIETYEENRRVIDLHWTHAMSNLAYVAARRRIGRVQFFKDIEEELGQLSLFG